MSRLPRDLGQNGLVQAKRRVDDALHAGDLAQTGQLQEHLVNIVAQGRIAGKQPVVGIQPRGLGVVVASAQMHVVDQAVGLAAHD